MPEVKPYDVMETLPDLDGGVFVRKLSRALPAALRLNAQVFPDTDSRQLYARVSVLTSGEKPRFSLRMVEWEWHMREIAKEIEERVREELPDLPVYVGTSTFNLKG